MHSSTRARAVLHSVPGFVQCVSLRTLQDKEPVYNTIASSVIMFNVTQHSALRSMMLKWSLRKRNKELCAVWPLQYCHRVVAKLPDEITVNPIFTCERGAVIIFPHQQAKCDEFPICVCVKEQRSNWMHWPTISKAMPTWCELNWNVSWTMMFLVITLIHWLHLTNADVVCCCVTHHNALPPEAMENSMPKDDGANRSSVDIRIQKTQVRKQIDGRQLLTNTHIKYLAHT